MVGILACGALPEQSEIPLLNSLQSMEGSVDVRSLSGNPNLNEGLRKGETADEKKAYTTIVLIVLDWLNGRGSQSFLLTGG
jgi:hypothetical protein